MCINLLERNWGARAYDCLYYRQCPLFGWWIWILQVFHNRAVNERETKEHFVLSRATNGYNLTRGEKNKVECIADR